MILEMLAHAAAAAPQGFDVEAATRAWLDTLQGPARAKSDAYFEGGYWMPLWGTLLSLLLYYFLLRFGWAARLRDWAERVTKRRWLQPALFALPFFLIVSLISLPWSVYAGYIREKQYDLMNLSFGAWLAEQAIGLVISLLIGALLMTIIFAVIRRAPRTWWLWGAGTLTLFLALGMLIAPVFIAPLFNEYKPMAAGPLRDSILAMAREHDVPAQNVYVFDQSRQHKRISANVSGLGPTIRISLNDNLLERSSPAEVKAVMGHELGHYVLGHVRNILIAATLLTLGIMFLLWWLTPRLIARYGARWGVRSPDDPAAVPIYLAIVAVVALLLVPVLNTLVRTQESQADAFGLDAAREPDGFASTAMKLSEYRKIEPSPLEEALFFDHPSGRTRVRMAMEWKARHRAQEQEPPPSAPGVR